jgi:hypothetical protein
MCVWEFKVFVFEIPFDSFYLFIIIVFDCSQSKLHAINPQIKWVHYTSLKPPGSFPDFSHGTAGPHCLALSK